MTQYIPFTTGQLEALATLYKSGKSTHALAKIYGISPTTVGRRLADMGITLRPLRENRTVTAQVLATAKMMRDQGKPWRQVEKATGVKIRSILCAMRRQRASE